MSHGWIKERFLRDGSVSARALAVKSTVVGLTAGTEAANVIAIAIQLEDDDGNSIASAEDLLCELLDANAELHAAAAFTAAETGVGAEVTATARPRIIITTDATGAAELSVTDVVGASGATVQVVATPLAGGPARRLEITFD